MISEKSLIEKTCADSVVIDWWEDSNGSIAEIRQLGDKLHGATLATYMLKHPIADEYETLHNVLLEKRLLIL